MSHDAPFDDVAGGDVASGDNSLLGELDARGLIADTTDRATFAARLNDGPITLYCGFDPTASSLHVGNLMGLLMLRKFQEHGHVPIVVAGGATGMIGDPSGRSTERNLLSDEELAANLEGIVPQLRQFLDFETKTNPAKLVDNRAWTVGVGVLDFLRDIGKHVTVSAMMNKESVRSRIGVGEGVSYTEFSYMLLQGYDYLWLAENEGCELQVGGSDQWGNIVLGVDLIRRKLGRVAHALTWPLLTRADGSKYGKTASGETIWLSTELMSPYSFYQAWRQLGDEEAVELLYKLTDTWPATSGGPGVGGPDTSGPDTRSVDVVPGHWPAELARQLTELVHGDVAARDAVAASDVLFGALDVREATPQALRFVADTLRSTVLGDQQQPIVDVLIASGLASSRGEARRAIAGGGIYVNGERVDSEARTVGATDALAGGVVLLRHGKKTWHALRIAAK